MKTPFFTLQTYTASQKLLYEHILELVKYRLMLNKSKTALCAVLYLKWINIYKQTINKYMDILDLMLIKKTSISFYVQRNQPSKDDIFNSNGLLIL